MKSSAHRTQNSALFLGLSAVSQHSELRTQHYFLDSALCLSTQNSELSTVSALSTSKRGVLRSLLKCLRRLPTLPTRQEARRLFQL